MTKNKTKNPVYRRPQNFSTFAETNTQINPKVLAFLFEEEEVKEEQEQKDHHHHNTRIPKGIQAIEKITVKIPKSKKPKQMTKSQKKIPTLIFH